MVAVKLPYCLGSILQRFLARVLGTEEIPVRIENKIVLHCSNHIQRTLIKHLSIAYKPCLKVILLTFLLTFSLLHESKLGTF